MEQLYNTVGAAKYLGCTTDNVHQRVRTGSLKAYHYNESGELIKRPPGKIRANRGQGLYFYKQDLDEYQITKKVGRPPKNT